MARVKDILTAVSGFFDGLSTPAGLISAPEEESDTWITWEVINDVEDQDQASYGDQDAGTDLYLGVHCWGATAEGATDVLDELFAAFKSTPITPTGWRPLRRPRRELDQLVQDPDTRAFQHNTRWHLRFTKA